MKIEDVVKRLNINPSIFTNIEKEPEEFTEEDDFDIEQTSLMEEQKLNKLSDFLKR